MELFNSSCHCTANTDTIATHDQWFFSTIFIKESSTKCFTVFYTKFKYLSYFNTMSHFYWCSTMRTWVSLGNKANITEIAFWISIFIVAIFFICTANSIMHFHYCSINNHDCIFAKTDWTHETRHTTNSANSRLFCHF